MSLEKAYREFLKDENFLKNFPFFTGEWEIDREMFEKMSDANMDLEPLDSETFFDDYSEDDYT